MNAAKRFILVTPMRQKGGSGVETYTNIFHEYLNRVGIDSTIITPYSYLPFIVYPVFVIQKIMEAIYSEWGIGWSRFWRYYFLKRVLNVKLKQLAKCGNTVVIYAQCPLSAKAALESRITNDQKVFMVVHYNISQADEWAGKGKIKLKGRLYEGIKSLEEKLIPQLDGIVFVSQFMKRTIEEAVPQVKSVQSVFFPCFTNKPQLTYLERSKRDLINIGTMETRKNQAYLLHVLAYAKQKGYSYSLTLVGEGPERENLERLSKTLGISDQVLFLGFQDNAARYLNNHRVYVHSAYIENLPIALLEALAYNLPIIAGAVGGIPEIFRDGVEGFYWPLDNHEKGAEILINLIENPDVYKSISQATQRRFSTQFETDSVASQLLLFLRA